MAIAPIASIPFDPARLKHRILFSKPVFSVDEPWKGPTGSEVIAEVWAGLLEVTSAERTTADQRSNSQEISFLVRFREDLEAATVLDFGGQTMDLLSLHDPDGSKRWLVVKARRALGDE